MRISLSPNGQPTITDANASSIEDIVRNMMARDEGPTDEQNMLPAETMEQSQGMEGGALMVVEEESSSSDEQGYQQVMQFLLRKLVFAPLCGLALLHHAVDSDSQQATMMGFFALACSPC